MTEEILDEMHMYVKSWSVCQFLWLLGHKIGCLQGPVGVQKGLSQKKLIFTKNAGLCSFCQENTTEDGTNQFLAKF